MSTDKEYTKKIIIALDVGSREEALALVKVLPEAETFKVGLTLFISEGPSFLSEIQNMRKKIFLDLKLHDIPNQVAGAVRAGVRLGVQMMTLHASGGREMMAQAAEAARQESERLGIARPLLLAVTVLTSLKGAQLRDIGMDDGILEQVLRLARLAAREGMDGVVCSPHEIEFIKRDLGPRFLVVSPGIRPEWSSAQDQKRILTPSGAIRKGVDYMVIGRPVTQASSPSKAFLKIVEELHHTVDASDRENSA
jgi:orotidine-5'-phosphate decarboxylase